MGDSNHKGSLIYIGCNDVTLFAQVAGLADDVVPTIFYLCDIKDFFLPFASCPLPLYLYPVANGYGVGATDTTKAEVALHLTIKKLAVVSSDNVPASRILND